MIATRRRVISIFLIFLALVVLYVCPATAWLIGNQSYFILKLIPVPSPAQHISTATTNEIVGWWAKYEVALGPSQVIQFYEEQLVPRGWRVVVNNAGKPYGVICLNLHHWAFTSASIGIIYGGSFEEAVTSSVTIYIPPAKSPCD